MIHNLETLDRTIDKICRDLGLGQDDIPYADFIEWIADALQHIGAYQQFTEKECIVRIEDYEGLLPCDLHKVIRMKLGCEVEPGEGGFYGGTLVSMLNKAGVDYESLNAYDRYSIIAVPGITKMDTNLGLEGLTNHLSYNGNLIGNPKMNKHTELDFNVNFNKITTSFRHGFIEVQYLSFPIDERGWPLVPDNVSYRDALFWKCAYHMSMRDPSKLRNPQMQDMEYCRQQWNRVCVQARAEGYMPGLDGMIRLKNQWLSLHNVLDHDRNGFRDLGKQQNLNLDGRY